jgi:CHAT domain-containing protein
MLSTTGTCKSKVYGLDLTAATDLVVLSACQTSVGQVSGGGDEVISFPSKF